MTILNLLPRLAAFQPHIFTGGMIECNPFFFQQHAAVHSIHNILLARNVKKSWPICFGLLCPDVTGLCCNTLFQVSPGQIANYTKPYFCLQSYALWLFHPLCRPVPGRHNGLPAGLSEEGEGEDGSVPGSGAASGGCQGRNPAVPLQGPWDHQGCPATQRLCTQVSVYTINYVPSNQDIDMFDLLVFIVI